MEKKVLIIIPSYNEEENVVRVFETCQQKNEYHYLFINDGSTDKTGQLLDQHSIPHVDLVQNLGIGGAVQTGYKYAYEHDFDIAVQFDGDGQHDINYVKNIIDPILRDEADFVIGSRFIQEMEGNFQSSGARRMGIKLISFFIRLMTKVKVYDTTSGFRAVNKKIIKEFANNYPSEYPEPITTTRMLKKGYRLKEVPVLMHERQGGTSSIGSWKNVYYMINVILNILLVDGR
ncbi:MAG: glycosyltransferase family 2 protein [Bacillota bacterium]|nr:glycosyltransferase family 2 protein [Bacillota bacterium]